MGEVMGAAKCMNCGLENPEHSVNDECIDQRGRKLSTVWQPYPVSSSLDRAGKIFVGDSDTIIIDGLSCSMEFLVGCVNPDPTKTYRAERRGDDMRITQIDGKLDKLAHGIAYDACCTVIESNCLRAGHDGCVSPDYFSVAEACVDGHAGEAVKEALEYLEARGLIVRHADNADWIQLQDESEATA